MSITDSFFVYSPDSKVGTFSFDDTLPPLPLQTLDTTLSNYFNSLLPLASEAELESAKKVIHAFRNGVGKELDDVLQQKAKKEKNWLDEWWVKYAYLSGRYPLIPFCNMFGHSALNDLYDPYPQVALKIATTDLYYLIEFWRLLRTEKLKTVQNAESSPIFCSAQFRRLYNTVRIPGEKIDALLSYFKTEKEGSCPEHFIAMRNGRIFKIDTKINGKPVSPSQLEQILSHIKKISDTIPGQSVGYMTCDDRESWARNRHYLQSLSEQNKNILQLIEESMFVISMDSTLPKDTSTVCKLVMCNNYGSRWADKSFAVVYFDSGFIAGMCDHTAFDGTISGVASYYIYSKIQEHGLDWYKAKMGEIHIEPEELVFNTDDCIEKEISRLECDLQKNKESLDIISDIFKGFGKKYLKEIKIHPDAFVQMALQLTYYKMYNKLCATYETATTRHYYKGRTETLRSCTLEALEWVKTMCDPNENDDSKRKLFVRATSRHNQLMNEAKKNAGCDRHLFGLYCLVLENNMEIPEFFTHELYSRSGGNGNYVLSTSLSGYSPMGGAVAPMCLDGYGIFYNICEDEIRFYVTTYRHSSETDCENFFNNICQSLVDMKKIFATHHNSKL